MNKMFKLFKSEVHTLMKHISENQGMRITGDCTPPEHFEHN